MKHKTLQKVLVSTLAVVVGLTPLTPVLSGVTAASLTAGSLILSDSRPSTSSTYTIEFSGITLSTIKCIKVVLSDASTGGSAPTGISTTGVTYSAASSDFVPDVQTWVAAETATGAFKITNATGETPGSATDGTVAVTGITNGSTAETGYFAQFSTYNNIDCSSSAVDSGVTSFIYTTGQAVSLTVDPSLAFTVDAVAGSQSVNGVTTTVASTDGTIPFGTVTTSANGVAAHDLTVTTNAGSGYTVYTRYTQAPTNGVDSINDLATYTNLTPGNFSAAGTEAFGYTTNDATLSTAGDGANRFTTPASQFAAFTTSNAEVAYSTAGVTSEVTRVGYQVGIAGTTPAGTYNNSTVIFTATPAY